MKKWMRVLQFVLLLAVGLLLCYLSFEKLDMHALLEQVRRANYMICIPVYLVSVIGYWARSMRWKLLMNAMDVDVRRSNLFIALCVGYLVNFAVPRLGEVIRCTIIRRTDHAPIEKSLASIVVERVIDIFSLLLLLGFALLMNADGMGDFIRVNMIAPLRDNMNSTRIMIGLVICVAGVLVLNRFIARHLKGGFIARQWNSVRESLRAMLMLKKKGLFLLYTVIIWSCYYLMMYLWIFLFPESSGLSPGQGFFLMVIGSMARSIPIQGGGIGAFHFLVSHAFALFGVSLLTGNALALIIHGAASVLTFLTGFLCLVWLAFRLKARTSQA